MKVCDAATAVASSERTTPAQVPLVSAADARKPHARVTLEERLRAEGYVVETRRGALGIQESFLRFSQGR